MVILATSLAESSPIVWFAIGCGVLITIVFLYDAYCVVRDNQQIDEFEARMRSAYEKRRIYRCPEESKSTTGTPGYGTAADPEC